MQRFTYSKPRTAQDAVREIAAGRPGTRFIAGGTTLYDLMKLDVEAPTRILDIAALPGFGTIDTGNPRELVFGAGARMAEVAAHAGLREEYPALVEALDKAASQQLRNMASLGGNLLQRTRCNYFRGGAPYACNKRLPGSGCAAQQGLDRGHAVLGGSDACIAVYPGDWAVALAAFDAVVDVQGPSGQRSIPLAQFHREPGSTPEIETTLARDELILRIRVPKTPLGRASTYHKIRDRESYAFALASAAVALRMDGSTVREARIALGGLATRPWRASEAERGLVAKSAGRRGLKSASRPAEAAKALSGAPTSTCCHDPPDRSLPGFGPRGRKRTMRSHRLNAVPPPAPSRVAIYARVSSDQQAERRTIDSQLSELKALASRSGHEVKDGMLFVDNGHSGTTLVRPALERLRDMVALSAVEVVYVQGPDRLARSYTLQVLLLEEFARADARVVFLNRPIGDSPEDNLLLQLQGMFAGYERAKLLERSRRGKRHRAEAGAVSVLSGTPSSATTQSRGAATGAPAPTATGSTASSAATPGCWPWRHSRRRCGTKSAGSCGTRRAWWKSTGGAWTRFRAAPTGTNSTPRRARATGSDKRSTA